MLNACIEKSVITVLTAGITTVYRPRSSSIKLPDIPGRMSAQIAMHPEIKMYHQAVFPSAGLRFVINRANKVPARK